MFLRVNVCPSDYLVSESPNFSAISKQLYFNTIYCLLYMNKLLCLGNTVSVMQRSVERRMECFKFLQYGGVHCK
jgi:hypothetical protein